MGLVSTSFQVSQCILPLVVFFVLVASIARVNAEGAYIHRGTSPVSITETPNLFIYMTQNPPRIAILGFPIHLGGILVGIFVMIAFVCVASSIKVN